MRRLLILPTVAAVLLTTAAPAALAADGAVVHRESVLTELDASGAPGTSRVFTQMTVPKGEKVTLSGQSTASLRTLSGAMSRDGGDLVFGGGLSRTVADHTAELPVEVEVTYSIDGRTVDARDVVGHDGEVAVTYVVRNLTTQTTEVTMIDGDRVASKETVDVAVPLVGSLKMTLPPAFSEITAPGAVVVGDGRGNTVVNWSLLLFSPLGSETQEVTWTAAARDAVVPEASLQVIPVSPASFGSFDSTAAAYDGAVGSTRELTAGARQIDRNLKLLAEGAGKLLAGLTQLRDGSAELAAGLGDARDGSAELSAGLGSARAGAGELSSGLGELAAGSSDLAGGVGEIADGAGLVDENAKALAAGSTTLAGGASNLQAGIEQLNSQLTGADGLPAALAGIEGLRQGVLKAQAGIGEASTPDTLRSGVAGVNGGLGSVETLADVVLATLGAVGLSDTVIDDLSEIDPSPLSDDDQSRLAASILALAGDADPAAPIVGVVERVATIKGTASVLQAGLGEVDAGLVLLSAGLGDPTVTATVVDGVTELTSSVSNPVCDPANPTDPANPCGILEGLEILRAGLSDAAVAVAAGLGDPSTEGTLRWGAAQVAGGSAQVAGGASQLQAKGTAAVAAGAEKAAAGAEELAAGTAKADAGAGELAAGTGQLDDGGDKLADGLVDAADGSQQLADGLASAVPGGQQIAGGTQQLTDEGTSVLARSVSDASASSSLQLAHVRAVAARGTEGDGLPYPTVDGAMASAVYEFELAGVGVDTGPGTAGRIGLGALALLAAALLGSLAGGRTGRRDEIAAPVKEHAEV